MKKEIVINMDGFNKGDTEIAELVALANRYQSTIYFEMENQKVNVKSIMGMMSLVLKDGLHITIHTEGSDDEKALLAMENFLAK